MRGCAERVVAYVVGLYEEQTELEQKMKMGFVDCLKMKTGMEMEMGIETDARSVFNS